MLDKFVDVLTKEQLLQIVKQQDEENKFLKAAIKKFVDKNFKGGPKADREDYVQTVTCKDVWDLYLIVKDNKEGE